MPKCHKARGYLLENNLLGFLDEDLVPIEKARELAQICGHEDNEAIQAVHQFLNKAIWFYQGLASNTDHVGRARPSYSEIRKKLKEDWLPKARALKRMAESIDPDTEMWLEIGARFPEKDGKSIPSTHEPAVANLGPYRIQNTLRAIKALPTHIEFALKHLPTSVGAPDKNFPARFFLSQLWPIYTGLTGKRPTLGKMTTHFAEAALSIVGEEYDYDALRELLRRALGRRKPKKSP